jgi:dihydroorotase/N-acyl-D-amino-acid deacylase
VPFDLLLTGGSILDGTGTPGFRADIGIRNGRIAALGDLFGMPAIRHLEASGVLVAPGFIDLLGTSDWTLLADSRAASKITQGITLMVAGERFSAAPLSEERRRDQQPQMDRLGVAADWTSLSSFFACLGASPPALNFATFVATGSLRDAVMPREDRPASASELAAMRGLAAEAMEDGALGVASALMYVPHRYATTDELVELASVAGRYGGIYATHQRSEGDDIEASLDEVFRVAAEAGVPAHIFHLKTTYARNAGRMREVAQRIEAARERGLAITADVYPYTAACGNLRALLPPWAREGGREATLARLRDSSAREQIVADLGTPGTGWDNEYLGAGPDRITIAETFDPSLAPAVGQRLSDLARARLEDSRETLLDLLLQDLGRTRILSCIMDADDVAFALQQPWTAFSTDSEHRAVDGPLATGRPHPRAYGAFPRVLGRCVREDSLFSLEEAVRKATALPASILGLRERGLVREGFHADLVAFEPDKIIDRATYEEPHQYAAGIEYVIVGGQLVVDRGRITAARPGRVVRGSGYRGQGESH